MFEQFIPGMVAAMVILLVSMVAYYLLLTYDEYLYEHSLPFDYRSSGTCNPCPPLIIPKPLIK